MSYPPAPTPFPPQPVAPARSGKLAVWALVVAIVALVFSWVPVFGLLLGLAGAVLGALGISKSLRRVMAIISAGLAVLACVINIIVIAAAASAVTNVSESLALAPSTASSSPVAERTTEATTVTPTTEAPAPVVTTKSPAAVVTTKAPETVAPKPTHTTPAESVAQENARESAESYLDSQAFSRSGLIKQLKYEGFSTALATYAVNAVHADWNKQAAKSAQSYLDSSSFSRSGLIDQLKYEGFTTAQATYGVKAVGL